MLLAHLTPKPLLPADALPEARVFRLPSMIDCEADDSPELARRFAAGDRQAAEQVVQRYQPMVARCVARLVDYHGAEEIVQDVFLVALERRRQFRGDSRLETWLIRIALNCCRHRLRQLRLRRLLLGRWSQCLAARVEQSPDERLVQDERQLRVRRAVARLPTKYREVTLLFYLEDMTSSEIAEVLRLREPAVRKRLERARRQLAAELADLVDPSGDG